MCGQFTGFDNYYRLLVQNSVRKAEISRVIVSKGFRKKGLGEVLVDKATSVARERGIDRLFLACKEEHQSFYEQCGFTRIPDLVCEKFDQYGVKAIAMDRPV